MYYLQIVRYMSYGLLSNSVIVRSDDIHATNYMPITLAEACSVSHRWIQMRVIRFSSIINVYAKKVCWMQMNIAITPFS